MRFIGYEYQPAHREILCINADTNNNDQYYWNLLKPYSIWF